MKRKMIAGLLIFAMLFTCVPTMVLAADDIQSNDFTYEFNYIAGETIAIITGYIGSERKVTIPENVEYYGSSYTVTQIKKEAFKNQTNITSITIPDSVTTIGYDAFRGCTSLTKITIPNSVTTIAENTFNGCTSLTTITIPNSVTTIGGQAFYSCKNLNNITIPASVTTIGYGVFYHCESLTNLTVEGAPSNVEYSAYGPNNRALIVDNGEKVLPNVYSYLAGMEVGIKANAPAADYHFKKWISDKGGTFADELAADTIFTMPDFTMSDTNVTVTATYEACSGGTATCTAKAVCDNCQQEYGKVLGHNWSTDWTNDANYHWHDCLNANCPVTENAQKDGYMAHTPNADDGNCKTAILCSVCNTVTTAANGNHSYSQKHDSNNHWKECDNCDVATTAEAHSYGSDNICDVCGYDKTPASSGGFSGTYNYPVIIGDTDNATVTLDPAYASAGETVTVIVKPDNGYGVAEVIVTDEKGNVIPVTYLGNGEYSFEMPAGKVNIETVCKPAITLTIGSQMANVFGKNVKNDVAPIITEDGRTMLPIRFIAEALGADVSWNEATQTVTITKDGVTVQIIIGADYAYINGERVELDSAAFIENNRTYLPLRFVAEALGADVNWDAATKQVVIMK